MKKHILASYFTWLFCVYLSSAGTDQNSCSSWHKFALLLAYTNSLLEITMRRSFSNEQKQKAISRSKDHGMSVTAAATEFGITRRLFLKWKHDESTTAQNKRLLTSRLTSMKQNRFHCWLIYLIIFFPRCRLNHSTQPHHPELEIKL